MDKVLQQRLFISSRVYAPFITNTFNDQDKRLAERCSYTKVTRRNCGCSDCSIVYKDVRILKRVD